MVIANRYAKSLLDLSLEKNQLDSVYKDMVFIRDICTTQKEFLNFLRSPIIKTDKKQSILKEVFKNNLTDISLSFLNILAVKRREGYIDKIATSFIEQYKSQKNILSAKIISANGISEEVRSQVINLLKKTTSGEVELEEKINKDLIGGFVLRIEDKQIDASVQRKLNDLKKSFSENPYVSEI